MPTFNVSKSVRITASVEEVYGKVRNFREWPSWSPWLIAEPGAGLEYDEEGKSYSWEGRITGAGGMTVLKEEKNRFMNCELVFLKPWKSVNRVDFLFSEREGGTEVTWKMKGSLPFFMFWMKGMMVAFIGSDYERGLKMLKAVVETGVNPSRLDFEGKRSFGGCGYVGVRTLCGIEEISERMGQDMGKVSGWLGGCGKEASGKPFAIYHKWDPAKGKVEYTIAMPVDGAPADPGEGLVGGEIPACEVYVVKHTGPYEFLGNAWASGMMHGRAKVFAADKKIDPFEIYENDPQVVKAEELVTTVHFPMK
ncbi:MAG: SRPBCC family protein [Luteolibacter sp.]